MSEAVFAAVDWGTSSFRLWLMGKGGAVLGERRSGEGMTTAAKTGFAEILAGHLAALRAPSNLPVIICGMAGARQGWVEAGYIDTPAPLDAIVRAAVPVPGTDRDIRILPGLAQRDTNAADVMRGEETQLLGALARLAGAPDTSRHLVCMPGTHSKWVRLAGRKVEGFSTFMTGELFATISSHTILQHSVSGAAVFGADHPAFVAALATMREAPALATNRLFSVRAAQLLHGAGPTDGRARLSGTLIGLEIAGALDLAQPGDAVVLIVSGPLGALYRAGLAAFDLTPVVIDADAAVRDGLCAAADALWFDRNDLR